MLLDEINTRFTNLPPDLWEKVKNPVGVLSAATSGAKGLPAIRYDELQIQERLKEIVDKNVAVSKELSDIVTEMVDRQRTNTDTVSLNMARIVRNNLIARPPADVRRCWTWPTLSNATFQ